jgi:hypothetical protein
MPETSWRRVREALTDVEATARELGDTDHDASMVPARLEAGHWEHDPITNDKWWVYDS